MNRCPECNSTRKPQTIHTSVVVVSNRGKVLSIEHADTDGQFYWMCVECGEQWKNEEL